MDIDKKDQNPGINKTDSAIHEKQELFEEVRFDSDSRMDEFPSAGTEVQVPQQQIAGFWRRILAFFLDSVLISAVGAGFGVLFFDQFALMGNWGRLVGLAIFLAYFGFLNSHFGNGQTIGKRITKIRVVNREGQVLSLGKSMFRAVVLGLPGILNNLYLTPSMLKSPIEVTLLCFAGLIIFGGGFGICYFYLFNRITRQSLHDLIVKTYVVQADNKVPLEVGEVWKGHYIVFAVFMIVLCIGSAVGLFVAREKPFFKNMITTLEQVGNVSEVYSAEMNQGMNYGSSGRSTFLNVKVHVKEKRYMTKSVAEKVADVVLKNNPGAMKVDRINITIEYGYDIGIASKYINVRGSFSPQEWNYILER